MSSDDVDLLKWPEPLPPSWQCVPVPPATGWDAAFSVTENGRPAGTVSVAYVVSTPIAAAYPAGLRDRLIHPDAEAGAPVIQLVSERVMAADPTCRRLVLAVDEGDVAGIARGEAAGFRYVLDVDVPGRSLSLLAAEPESVLEDSRHLDDVPTK